jgi:hypothetical protein
MASLRPFCTLFNCQILCNVSRFDNMILGMVFLTVWFYKSSPATRYYIIALMASIIICLFQEKNPFYATVAPLRLLFLKRDDLELWTRVNSLMDNNKAGRRMTLSSGPGSIHSWTTTREVEG